MAQQRRNQRRVRPVRQDCSFCKNGTDLYFGDFKTLEELTSDRGKIMGRKRSGLCAKHQRKLSQAVKRARFIGLLPFSERVLS